MSNSAQAKRPKLSRWTLAIIGTNGLLAVGVVVHTWMGANGPSLPPQNITSADLVAAYDEDETRANARFRNKVLQVTGPALDAGRDSRDKTYLLLDGGTHPRKVQAFLSDAAANDVYRVRPGGAVTVQGTCAGLESNVVLTDAHVAPRAP